MTTATTPSTWTCECGRANADLPDVRFCAGCGKRRPPYGSDADANAGDAIWYAGFTTPGRREACLAIVAKAREVLGVDKMQARIAELEAAQSKSCPCATMDAARDAIQRGADVSEDAAARLKAKARRQAFEEVRRQAESLANCAILAVPESARFNGEGRREAALMLAAWARDERDACQPAPAGTTAARRGFLHDGGGERSCEPASAPQPGEVTTKTPTRDLPMDHLRNKFEREFGSCIREVYVGHRAEWYEQLDVECVRRFLDGEARAAAADKAMIAELRARIDELKESWSGLNDANNEKASEIAELRRQHDEDTLALRVIRKSAAETASDRDRECSRVEKAEVEHDAARAELATDQPARCPYYWDDKQCELPEGHKGHHRYVKMAEQPSERMATDRPAETKT